jgi:uncharacterized protein involved in exopolysaccharide biosynthesis
MSAVAPTEQQLIATRSDSSKRGKVFAMRMAESFFRRWPLYLLPVLLFVGLGVLQAKGISKTWRSVGSVNVSSSTFLSDLTSVRTPDVGYETPATKTARDMNERMGSDAFATTVADTAGLKSALATGAVTLDYVRAHVSAAPAGDTLLQVSSVTDSPQLSRQLAGALIVSYTSYVLSVEVADSNTALQFYQDRITKDQAALDTAQQALLTFLKNNPAPSIGERDEVQTVTIQGLQTTVATAQTAVNDDGAKLNEAQLKVTSAKSDINQRLSVADEPNLPLGPEPVKMKQVFALAIFALLGLLVVIIAVVIAALLDRAVRSSDDILAATGLEVVATIPVRKKSGKVTATKRKQPAVAAGAA